MLGGSGWIVSVIFRSARISASKSVSGGGSEPGKRPSSSSWPSPSSAYGNGPISWTTASADDGSLDVTFERFGRRGGSQSLAVTAPATAADGGVWEIELSQGFLDSMKIDAITPQPKSVEAVDGGIRYTFSQAGGADLEAELSLTPQKLWSRDAEIRIAEKEPVHLNQFLFP